MPARKAASRKKKATQKRTTRKKARSPKRPRSRKAQARRRGARPDAGGRPAIEWNDQAAKDLTDLVEVGNTLADCAAILGVSKSALEKVIADADHLMGQAYERARANRRGNLRTWQTRSAKRGNATMQIWLGKQELGQRDVKAVEVSGPDGGAVPLEGDVGPILKRRLAEYLRAKGKGPTRRAKPPVRTD